jgi:hypothetical protein
MESLGESRTEESNRKGGMTRKVEGEHDTRFLGEGPIMLKTMWNGGEKDRREKGTTNLLKMEQPYEGQKRRDE